MSVRRTVSFTLAVGWFAAISGCDQQFPAGPVGPVVPAAPVANQNDAQRPERKEGCQITGRIVSKEWGALAGGIERAIVTAATLPDQRQVAEVFGDGGRFEFYLPPGKYRIDFSANGTRGATFKFQNREIEIAKGQDRFDLGDVDLAISKTTSLYGRPAPELDGIIGWQNTPPIAIKDLRGKIIVLDFFADYCSLCHAHKPDLQKLRQQYGPQGLVVLAIHDATIKTIDEMNEKMEPILRHVFHGDPPRIPMALDSGGETGVFGAYGVHAVPAVILIDQRGHVVRRYHHAGEPELEADVQTLLRFRSKRNP